MVSDILIAVRENDMRALPTFCRAMHSVYHARISNWTNLLMSQNSCMVVSVHVISLHSFNVNFLNNFSTELRAKKNRSSRPEVFRTKSRSTTLLKKRLWHRCFSVNFATFSRTHFLQNTSGGCFCIFYAVLLCWCSLDDFHGVFF